MIIAEEKKQGFSKLIRTVMRNLVLVYPSFHDQNVDEYVVHRKASQEKNATHAGIIGTIISSVKP